MQGLDIQYMVRPIRSYTALGLHNIWENFELCTCFLKSIWGEPLCALSIAGRELKITRCDYEAVIVGHIAILRNVIVCGGGRAGY